MGRCAEVSEKEDGYLFGTGCLFIRTSGEIFKKYLVLCLLCDTIKHYLTGTPVGATMNNLKQKVLNNLLVPFPPLAEQKHIFAKVHQLMALCEDLEAKLGAGQDKSGKLLKAAVADLLAA